MEEVITNNPNGYPDIRNIFSRYKAKFVYKRDFFDLGLKFTHLITGKGYQPFWKGLYYNFTDQTTKCIFFNTINLGQNPWVVYFETTIPRLGITPKFFYKYAVKQLTKKNCLEVIAISQCAYDMQIRYLRKEYPQYLELIKDKMKVELPPQKPLVKSYSEKQLPEDKIIFSIVGADFFRKGGREILQVLDLLIPQYPQLYLNIISSMQYGDYATRTTEADFENAVHIIEKYPNNISHYPDLPNSEVLELLKNSHIGLLPTWADSFGYSVLEAQAAGCPVITTDIRALPEVNNNKLGWVIKVPKANNNEALINSPENRRKFSKILNKSLTSTLLGIINNPKIIKSKGLNSLKEIKIRYEVSIS